MNTGYNTIDLRTGTKTYVGPCVSTKGNHSGMDPRDEAYLDTDERGHIQASSLSGSNDKENIAPQAKDLNHGSYLRVENGEKNALAKENTIETEKIAYSSNQLGYRPDAFIVNDTVTMPNGQQQTIHHSFANMQNVEQENLNMELDKYSDMLEIANPEDNLRAEMSTEEYAELMEITDNELPSMKDEYQIAEYNSILYSQNANEMFDEELEMEGNVEASCEWENSVSEDVNLDATDMDVSADLYAEME